MNNFQQMLNKARAAQKKIETFKTKEFALAEEQNGALRFKITGNYQFTALEIDYPKLAEKYQNDHETINAVIQIAINNAIKFVQGKENAIISE